MSKSEKKIQYHTLLSAISNGSTDNAQKLLLQETGEKARNPKELEQKLARMYAVSTKKIDLEKKFAEIHPHKDFILKYLSPKIQEQKPLQIEEKNSPTEEKVIKEVIVHDGYVNANGHAPCGNPNCPYCKRYFHQFSSCEGNPNCGCKRTSSACGCGFDGYYGADGGEQRKTNNDYVGLIGMVAVVGITFYVLSKTVK